VRREFGIEHTFGSLLRASDRTSVRDRPPHRVKGRGADGRERLALYEVPRLPSDYGALEPHLDEATMRVHYDKHHQGYVAEVNAALEGTD
jgi:Iron/manganese superoxide dismutases, alpha-hairpin domain